MLPENISNMKFDIISPLKVTEVNYTLAQITNLPISGSFLRKIFIRRNKSRPFSGSVSDGAFKIVPQVTGRNSFLPLISGSVEAHNDGSIIHVNMKLHPIALVAISAFVLGITGAATNEIIKKGIPINFQDLIPYMIAGILIFMTWYFFREESRKAKQELLLIVQGKIKE